MRLQVLLVTLAVLAVLVALPLTSNGSGQEKGGGVHVVDGGGGGVHVVDWEGGGVHVVDGGEGVHIVDWEGGGVHIVDGDGGGVHVVDWEGGVHIVDDAVNRRSWPCCNQCGMCNKKMPPECQCMDISFQGCHPRCRNCVKYVASRDPPIYRCADNLTNFCRRSCT